MMAELTMDNPLAPSPMAALTKSVGDLKECVGKLKEEFEDYHIPLNDDNQDLHRLCAKLEFLMQTGMKPKTSLLGARKDYWNYMAECLAANKSLNDGIKFVKSISELKTNLGRGRALIRFGLMHHRLADSVQQCVINGKLTSEWYQPKAVWLQHQLSSLVIGALYDLNDLQFDLSPQGYDLDTSWPTFAKKQFGSPYPGNWQPPSRSVSIASLQSIPQLEISLNQPSASPFATPDHRPLQQRFQEEEEEEHRRLVLEDSNDHKNLKEPKESEEEPEEADLIYPTMDAEQLRKRVMKLEDENHNIQRKSNDYEVTCEKLKNELALKTEIWGEKESFYKLKHEDAERTVAQLQERLAHAPSTAPSGGGGGGTSEMELKIKLMASEKRCEAFRIELQSVTKEFEAKVRVEDAKNSLVAMQDKRIAQLKRENEALVHKQTLEKSLAAKEAAMGVGADADSQQQIRILVEKLACQESAYAKLINHNTELKTMLNSIEDKSRNIARVAKEKVGAYNQENIKLKAQVAELKCSMEQIVGTQEEHKGKESSIQQHISEFGATIAAKNAEVERYRARVVELGKALQAAGFHADESTPDALIDALNESEFLSRQLQSGIESLKQKLGCPPSASDVTDAPVSDAKTEIESETKPAESETKPAESETKPECTAESETKSAESETKPDGTTESATDPDPNASSIPEQRCNVADVTPVHESDTKTKEEALTENRELVAMMEKIQAEEQGIIRGLKQEIEDKRTALEQLRLRKVESEASKREKERQLAAARDSILEQMSAKRAEMSAIREDISGLRTSVRSALDDMGTAVGIDDPAAADPAAAEEEGSSSSDGEKDVDMKDYLQCARNDIEGELRKYIENKTQQDAAVSQEKEEACEIISQLQTQLETLQNQAKEQEDALQNRTKEQEDALQIQTKEQDEASKKISELQTQLEMLQNQAKEQEEAQLQNQAKVQEEALQQNRAKVQAEEALEKSAEEEESALREELADLQTVVEDLRTSHASLQSENLALKTLKRQLVDAQTETEELMNELKLREGKLEESEETRKKLSEEKATLRLQVDSVERELAAKQDEYKTLASELDETKKVVKSGTKHETDLKAITEKLNMVSAEKSKAEEELLEKMKLAEMYEDQIQIHIKSIEDLTDERESLTGEQNELSTKLKDRDDVVVTLTEKVNLLQDGLENDVKVNMRALEQQLVKAAESRKTTETEKESVDAELHDTKRKWMELVQEHADMKAELNIKIDSIRQELDRVVTEKNEISSDRDKLAHSFNDSEQEIERLNENRNKLAAKIDAMEAQCDQAMQRAETLRVHKEALEEALAGAEKQRQDVSRERDEYGKKLNAIKSSLGDANAIQDEILKQADVANTEISTLKDQISMLETQVTQTKKETLDRVREVDDANTEIQSLKDSVDDLSENANKLYFELKERLGQSVCENDALRVELQRVLGEKEEAFRQLREDNSALQEQVEKLSTETETLTDRCCGFEELVAEKAELNERLDRKDAEEKEQMERMERMEREAKTNGGEAKARESEMREEVERLRKVLDRQRTEVETKSQEVMALEFQLSSQLIQHQTQLQSLEGEQQDVSALQARAEEQESLLETLGLELKETSRHHHTEAERHRREVENMKEFVRKEEAKCKRLSGEIKQKDGVYTALLEKNKKEAADLEKRHQGRVSELQRRLQQVEHDNELLKKKLIKLARDKDQLWQKTDELTYKQKVKAQEKWMESANVQCCLGCSSDFSFMLRKHHCRMCGRIYCYNCANNWVMTAHSSKKERVCNSCMMEQSQLQGTSEGEDTDDDDDEDQQDLEQTVEVPKMSASWLSQRAAAHSALPDDGDEEDDFPPGADSVRVLVVTPSGTDDTQQQQQQPQTPKESSPGSDDTETFDVITQADVAEIVHDPTPDPSMLSSTLFTEADLQDTAVEAEPELWVTAGNSYAVPVSIGKAGTTLKWEFTTYPKDIIFSLTFLEDPTGEPEELIAPCKCNSHKKAIEGELSAHKPGVYTLLFDNKASRFTSKKVHYRLQLTSPDTAPDDKVKVEVTEEEEEEEEGDST